MGPIPTTAEYPPDVDLATRIEALKAFLARRALRAEPEAERDQPPPTPPVPANTPAQAADFPLGAAVAPAPPLHGTLAPRLQQEKRSPWTASLLPADWTKRLWLAAVAALVVVIGLVALVAGVFPWSRQPATGAFSIDTRPPASPSQSMAHREVSHRSLSSSPQAITSSSWPRAPSLGESRDDWGR